MVIWPPVPHLNGSGRGETIFDRWHAPFGATGIRVCARIGPPIALQVQFNDDCQNMEFTLPGTDTGIAQRVLGVGNRQKDLRQTDNDGKVAGDIRKWRAGAGD